MEKHTIGQKQRIPAYISPHSLSLHKEKTNTDRDSRFPHMMDLEKASHHCLLDNTDPFSSVMQSCLTLCDPMDHSTPGLPVHHQLLEFTQTHVHQVRDAIQPSHPLSSPFPPAPNPSQHQSLLQHHSSKASILWCSAFFIVQLSHPYVTIGKTIALTIWTFVGKVMSLLFNTLSRIVITFLPRNKHLLIS